jgi:DNA-binding SARP family transcriptional activator/predicted ATPase
MVRLSLSFLGTFEVALAERPVTTFEYDKVRALLAYLAVEADRPHRREALAGLLWPEQPEAKARHSLSQALLTLERAIADRQATPACLIVTRQALQFNPAGDYGLDVTTFTGLLAGCEVHDHQQLAACDACLERLRRAATLYRGEFLAGFSAGDALPFEEWTLVQRERLERLAVEALGHLAGGYGARGEYQAALPHAWRRVELDPWQEAACRDLMRLLALSGQREAALAHYEACRGRLAAELDMEPAEETRRLVEQIRAGTLGRGAEEQRSRGAGEKISVLFPRIPAPLPHCTPAPFVAHERELAQLDRFLQAALAGQGRVVFVTGMAGKGKTALLQEFARRAGAAHPGLVVAAGSGNAYTGQGDPYLPFRQILGLLTGDVEARYASGALSPHQAGRLWALLPLTVQALLDAGPDLVDTLLPGPPLLKRVRALGLAANPSRGGDWLLQLEALVARKELQPGPDRAAIPDPSQPGQPAIFEQVAQVLEALARQAPLLLLLDDLQWADSASINLLFHLGRRIGGQRVLVLGAYRPAEVAMGRLLTSSGQRERHPLEPVVNEFRSLFGQVEVDLSRTDGRRFVDAYLDTQPNQLGETFRQTLYTQTGGHPLFTVELLRGMQERGDLVRDIQGCWIEEPNLDWETLPARVEAVIAERVGRLPEHLRQALTVASVEGQGFTAEAVARVCAVDEGDMVHRLGDQLERVYRLVRPERVQHTNGQRLSQYRFRHILFQKYLYRKLDRAERVYLHQKLGTALEDLYAEWVGDMTAQGPTLHLRLARHFHEAGITHKSIDYLRQAGERAARLAAHQQAIAHFRQGLRWLEKLPEGSERAQQELNLCLGLATSLQAAQGYGDPEVGRLYTRARLLCDQVADSDQSFHVLCLLSLYYLWQPDVHSAQKLGGQLLELAERTGDATRLMLAHYAQGWNLYALGKLASARVHLDQANHLYDPEQHRRLVFGYGLDPGVACRMWVSCVLWLLGYPDQARRQGQRALELARKLDHPLSLAFAHINLAVIHIFRREVEAALAQAEACNQLSTECRLSHILAAVALCRGWALAGQGQAEAGLAHIHQVIGDGQAGGGALLPPQLAMLAETYGLAGQPGAGLPVLDQAEAAAGRTGVRWYDAEIHRLRGDLLHNKRGADPFQVEVHYQQAIQVACQQEARSWELRAEMSLCRLWHSQGAQDKTQAARHMLVKTYGWFSEGFDTGDLQEARDLLDVLA